jgi:hypothetical protein
LLVAIYALFALAATARAGVQIGTKFGNAPVAYLLSAFAGVVYIIATVTLAVGSARRLPRPHRVRRADWCLPVVPPGLRRGTWDRSG